MAALVAVPGHRQLVAQDLDEIEAETDRINAWFEDKFEEQLAFSPIQQTFLGRSSDQIDEFTIEAFDARLAWQRASVAEMRAEFDYELLAEEARTSYDVWEYQLQQAEPSASVPPSRIRLRPDVGGPHALPPVADHLSRG